MTLESVRWMGPQTPFIPAASFGREGIWDPEVLLGLKNVFKAKETDSSRSLPGCVYFDFLFFSNGWRGEREPFRYNYYNVNNFFDFFPVQGAIVKSAVKYMCTVSYTYVKRINENNCLSRMPLEKPVHLCCTLFLLYVQHDLDPEQGQWIDFLSLFPHTKYLSL